MATLRSFSRPGRPAPSVPAMASLVVNGLLIAVLLTLGQGQRDERTQSPALTVLSLAALKGSEQGEEHAPTADSQASSAQQQRPIRQQVAPPPLPPALPVPLPLVRPATNSSPAAAAIIPAATPGPAPSPPSSPAAAAQDLSPQTARRGIADGVDADARPGKSLAYAAKVRSWLYAHKIYPRRARMRHDEGIVHVRFILDRTGALIEGMIVAGSGKASLDEEAIAMMRRASPYPRAPEAVSGDRLEFLAPIEFMLPV